jgi:DNA polymerase-3 subunit gamma/tau
MTAQALYRKWRPRTFDQVVGQEHVVRTLRNALVSGRVHHAYLFAGPRGTGKTTTARLLAKAVNCLTPEGARPCNKCQICVAINEGRLLDLIEIDAASNTGVDDVRELRERVGFRPNEARYKVYVIDEVHMLSNAAFNALLKTLEEPPEHAIFVLATTEPHKILPTVLSRCQRFDFRRIPVGEMVDRLAWLAEQEQIEVAQEALELIARQATGSMRDAESLLDQLASYNDGGITVDEMRAALGIGASETVMEITEALAERDVSRGLGAINRAVDEGTDPRQFARQMVEHLRALLLLRLESSVAPLHVSKESLPRLQDQATAFSRRELVRAVHLFNQAAHEAKGGWQPQLPLEMAFVEALLPPEPGRSDGGDDPSARRPKNPSSAWPGTSGTRHVGRSPVSGRQSRPDANEPGGGGEPGSPERSGRLGSVQEPAAVYQLAANDEGPLTPSKVIERWPDFLNALRPQDLKLEALMRSCEPVGVEEDVIVLSFAHKFHRSMVEEDEKRRLVEGALSDLFGRRLRVRCVISGHEGAQAVEEVDQTSPVPRAGVSGDSLDPLDPLVQMAVDELGAEVASR